MTPTSSFKVLSNRPSISLSLCWKCKIFHIIQMFPFHRALTHSQSLCKCKISKNNLKTLKTFERHKNHLKPHFEAKKQTPAQHIIMPNEKSVWEVNPLHKRLTSHTDFHLALFLSHVVVERPPRPPSPLPTNKDSPNDYDKSPPRIDDIILWGYYNS